VIGSFNKIKPFRVFKTFSVLAVKLFEADSEEEAIAIGKASAGTLKMSENSFEHRC
jgi:hypothetical protein